MATATATTRPARERKSTKTAKQAVAAKEAPASDDGMVRVTFEMNIGDETKTYTKVTPPKDSGCVGTLYVPKGVTQVKILLVGPAS